MDSKTFQIAQSYARSLFEVSMQDNKSGNLQEELFKVASALLNNKTFQSFANTPHVPAGQKFETLQKAFGETSVSKVLQNFILALVKNRRFYLMPAILVCFQKITYAYDGVCKIKAVTAKKLDDKTKILLRDSLQNNIEKPIEVNFVHDESLIGGLRVEFDKYVIDSSIKNKIGKLKAAVNLF